jgi:CelD/BcsL family acetyltransferase involved in cellulose biosynthesis
MTMMVSSLRPDDLGKAEEDLWRAYQDLSPLGRHPFFSLTYARAAARLDEHGRVAVVEDDGKIRAFIPYTSGADKIAGALGGGFSGVDGLVSDGAPIDLRTVIRKLGLRGWRFDHTPTELHALDPYRYEGDYHRTAVDTIDLRGGYDSYLQGLPKSLGKRLPAYRRAIERELGEITFDWHSKNPAHLDLLLDWKAAQFDSFRQWTAEPSVRQHLHELAYGDNADSTGVLNVLCAGGKPINVDFGMRCGDLLAGWFSAYDHDHSRLSIAAIAMIAQVEQAVTLGIELIDFGHGTNSFKQRLRNSTYDVVGGAVWASRLDSAARSLYRRTRFH